LVDEVGDPFAAHSLALLATGGARLILSLSTLIDFRAVPTGARLRCSS